MIGARSVERLVPKLPLGNEARGKMDNNPLPADTTFPISPPLWNHRRVASRTDHRKLPQLRELQTRRPRPGQPARRRQQLRQDIGAGSRFLTHFVRASGCDSHDYKSARRIVSTRSTAPQPTTGDRTGCRWPFLRSVNRTSIEVHDQGWHGRCGSTTRRGIRSCDRRLASSRPQRRCRPSEHSGECSVATRCCLALRHSRT